jgi:hypothetical protein
MFFAAVNVCIYVAVSMFMIISPLLQAGLASAYKRVFQFLNFRIPNWEVATSAPGGVAAPKILPRDFL